MSNDTASPDGGTPAPGYRERLWPAAWVWAATTLVAVSAGLVLLPLGPVPALVAGLGAQAGLTAGLVAWTPEIAVRDHHLIAGRARIPAALLGPATPLDAEAARRALGRDLDARAYLCVRGWVRTGIRVDLVDPADPTPYWLVSTRHPQRVVQALQAARRAAA